MRKLATLQQVFRIEPIAGADNIELARFMDIDWQCVVAKSYALQPGDWVVYFEIDSVLPELPVFEFMAVRHYRVKTIRLRGTLSQGLAIPVGDLTEYLEDGTDFFLSGEDVTDVIGVKLYEPGVAQGQAKLAGNQKSRFPYFIPKTDEERVQSSPRVLRELYGHEAVATVKADGTSLTVYKWQGEFGVCTRNFELYDSDCVYWDMARKYNLDTIQEGYALQMEIVGPGIQKNRMGLPNVQCRGFSVYNISERRYEGHDETECVFAHHGIPMVEVAYRWDEFPYFKTEDVLNLTIGYYPGTKQQREGLVFRPVREMYSQALAGRLSFKAINNAYLLKNEE